MMHDETVNQATNPLKKGEKKKKKNHQLCNSRISVLVVLVLVL
jgi:hypothetical protein